MPTISHIAVTTTSTAVASVNQTGEAMFGGRPFILRETFGWGVESPAVVLTANSSVTVHASNITTSPIRG